MKLFEHVLASNETNKALVNSAKRVAKQQEQKKFLRRLAKLRKDTAQEKERGVKSLFFF